MHGGVGGGGLHSPKSFTLVVKAISNNGFEVRWMGFRADQNVFKNGKISCS